MGVLSLGRLRGGEGVSSLDWGASGRDSRALALNIGKISPTYPSARR
jgi:hypothetical protein